MEIYIKMIMQSGEDVKIKKLSQRKSGESTEVLCLKTIFKKHKLEFFKLGFDN